ncbi:YbaB/EbfC family nucleoid-associated protein [Actinokineospora sp. PR83]|uniref:YbaB/EbfC family nucleoid-associated protein n=1 Tax=Actinokineospora sp. PR83 TaxID=2884908 RepID=UPI0027DF5F81|nr:YbaB/EbfC family nucleoid-associated protein [Actinokineospora sp. PR83]MCG8916699.1 YbaB/EbfC family nucleoid-associated protein [Actinokineospora sp. PR83]
MSLPSFGGDGFRTEQEMTRWAADVEAKAERYRAMQAEVAAVAVTEVSRDDVVRVTVDTTGAVTALEISDRNREMPGRELSALVLATMRRAQSRITERVAEVMERTVGDDPGTVAAVVGSYRERFPEPEPEDVRHSGGHVEEMTLGRADDPDDPPTPRRPPRRPRPETEDDDDNPWGGGSILS